MFAHAAPKKGTTPAAAVRAVPALPAVPSQGFATPAALINSDLGGRDMVFLEQAIDHRIRIRDAIAYYAHPFRYLVGSAILDLD